MYPIGAEGLFTLAEDSPSESAPTHTQQLPAGGAAGPSADAERGRQRERDAERATFDIRI